MKIRLLLLEANLYNLGIHKLVVDEIKSTYNSNNKGSDNSLYALLNWFKSEPMNIISDNLGDSLLNGSDYFQQYKQGIKSAKRVAKSGNVEQAHEILELVNKLFSTNFSLWFDKNELKDLYEAMSTNQGLIKAYGKLRTVREAKDKLDLTSNKDKSFKYLKIGDGRTWVDLETNECSIEANANDHCGKSVYDDSTLYSLRQDNKLEEAGTVLVEYNKGRNEFIQASDSGNTIPSESDWHALKLLYDRLGKPKIRPSFYEFNTQLTNAASFLIYLVEKDLNKIPYKVWRDIYSKGGSPKEKTTEGDHDKVIKYFTRKTYVDVRYLDLLKKLDRNEYNKINQEFFGNDESIEKLLRSIVSRKIHTNIDPVLSHLQISSKQQLEKYNIDYNSLRNVALMNPRSAYDLMYRFNEPGNDEMRLTISGSPELSYKYAINIDKGPHDVTRAGVLKSVEWSYQYAINIDKGPHDVTRSGVSKGVEWSYQYAINIDKGPHDVTRSGVSKSAEWSYKYAMNIDKGPHDITRSGVLKSAKWAYNYAKDVDRRQSRDDTRNAVLKDIEFAFHYARNIDKEPRDDTRSVCLKSPEFAYKYALEVDKGPRDDARDAVLGDPQWAYEYAYEIDQQPRDDTRDAVLKDPKFAFHYARNIDQQPRDDTRDAVLKDPKFAYRYALNIDKQPSYETRDAVLKDPEWAYNYALNVDRQSSYETRDAILRYPYFAYEYALNVDEGPRDDTRAAVLKDPKRVYLAYYYALEIDKEPHDDTRTAVLKDPGLAYKYALNVDKRQRYDTRSAAKRSKDYGDAYNEIRKPNDENIRIKLRFK